jgi:hypothetical protein
VGDARQRPLLSYLEEKKMSKFYISKYDGKDIEGKVEIKYRICTDNDRLRDDLSKQHAEAIVRKLNGVLQMSEEELNKTECGLKQMDNTQKTLWDKSGTLAFNRKNLQNNAKEIAKLGSSFVSDYINLLETEVIAWRGAYRDLYSRSLETVAGEQEEKKLRKTLEELRQQQKVYLQELQFRLHFIAKCVERNNAVRFKYTNYRGETSNRKVYPLSLYFGTSDVDKEYGYKIPQLLLKAYDLDKQAERTFAIDKVMPIEEKGQL